ncbi:MAG TPA: hypothetical protein VF267_09740 [Gammaproteobacteria bacterium]
MGVSKNADFDDFIDDDFEGDDFGFMEEPSERRKASKARKSPKAWRSVEDYLENKKLKRQLSDGFEDD